ncbi:alpha/beta hydrolase [Bradyrhizobium prioriisuperbiae]|uniref:alpha/beta fold hydrolase n=1 Tax=Bradyrhizobium prioriisuperbiae TaxID=2854389 RepID=UPI0028E9925A|nr:alpha/beta hydrolase [Bradyrhizobium prioritasuperba]
MPCASLQDADIHYEVAGQGAELVLLHELGGTLQSFDTLVPLLTQRFRVLRYDQRGAGSSRAVHGRMTIEDHAADLAQLLAAVGFAPTCRITSVAAGAAIAVAFASRSDAAVPALALCAPALAVSPERRAYLVARSDDVRRNGMADIVESTLGRSYPDALRTDHHTYEAYRRRFLANDPVSYAEANMALATTRIAEALPGLTMPCLVLAGRHDLLRPPADVEATARAIPNATFATIDSGHLMPVQAPQAMAEHLLRFFAPERQREAIDESYHE